MISHHLLPENLAFVTQQDPWNSPFQPLMDELFFPQG
jgi:hypothetical protein